MNTDVLSLIRHELTSQVDDRTRDFGRTFFKEDINLYGVKTPLVTAMAGRYYKDIKHLGKAKIFALCEELLRSDFMEEAIIAFDWAYRLRDEYIPGDFDVFESWVRKYVNNWAKCDTLCNHTIGSFIETYPQYITNLKRWAKSENRWFRRAAVVTLILPARRGKFLEDIFEIAGILLPDTDDLVQKGYGWLLKEASRMHQEEVFDYVMRHRRIMPRTALRYAIEKMPETLRHQAMGKEKP